MRSRGDIARTETQARREKEKNGETKGGRGATGAMATGARVDPKFGRYL